MPGVQLDAAEVDDPRESSRVVDDGEDGRVTAGEADELPADVFGMRRHPLLVEEVAVDAVREALHVERAPPNVVQRTGRDVQVVPDEVSLREPGKEELVRVGDGDLVPADTHAASIAITGSNTAKLASIAKIGSKRATPVPGS
jgi:hypothetical protein